MKDALAPLDRTTLAVWRTTNMIGWAAFAVAAALAVHWLAAEYSGRYFANAYLNAKPDFSWTVWFVLPKLAFRLGVTIIVALAIGGIVGMKTWRRQPLLAASAAAVYSLITIFSLQSFAGSVGTFRTGPQDILVTASRPGFGLGGTGAAGWVYDLLVLSTIPIAAAWARHVAKLRP
jgi:hypothetical protein